VHRNNSSKTIELKKNVIIIYIFCMRGIDSIFRRLFIL
jgi:hypothetical protein